MYIDTKTHTRSEYAPFSDRFKRTYSMLVGTGKYVTINRIYLQQSISLKLLIGVTRNDDKTTDHELEALHHP